MKVRQNGDELLIQETPGCLWIFGLFFAFVGGIFVYGSLGGFTNHERVSWWANIFALFGGALAVAVGVWQIFRAPVTKIIINRRRKTVVHRRRGLFVSEKNVYDFEQIKGFRTIQSSDSDGDSIWSFGMELTSGKIVEISSLPSHFEKTKRDVVFETNDFLRKTRAPFDKTLSESADESRREIR